MGILQKRCKTPGCPNLHKNPSGYCDACTERYRKNHPYSKEYEATRPSASERGYTWRWHAFARQYLQQHPTCVMCGAPATVCDHKDIPADIMLKMNNGHFDYDISHYQALCSSCNTKKGATTDKAIRAAYEADVAWLEAHDPEKPRGEG